MPPDSKPRALVVGAGPAGLMAAEVLVMAGAAVTVLERMPSPARKFLMAGRGGLNLTHSEPLERFLDRYGEASERMRSLVCAFPPQAVRTWSENLGQPTFVGSSGRIFPEGFKASPLLRAWLRRLGALGVRLETRRDFVALLPDKRLEVQTPEGRSVIDYDSAVLALGGASWPRLGSNGAWTRALAASGATPTPFRPANCGFLTHWSETFRARFAGAPLKGAAFSFGAQRVRGEATITASGLEGGAIYALSASLRDALDARGPVDLILDLRPDVSKDDLQARLAQARRRDLSTQKMRKALGLSPVAIGLVYESRRAASGAAAGELAELIKSLTIRLLSPAPLERAISTAGGVKFEDLDDDLMLRHAPDVFVCGEMLDFEAPTGGYLLQAALSTGFVAGRGAARRLGLAPSARHRGADR